jgi:3',5'-cyclic AMP phosphodiesterase CpdA
MRIEAKITRFALIILIILLGLPFFECGGDDSDTTPGENHPPELEPVGNKIVEAGEELTFIVTANDPDAGDTLTFTASDLPAGATFNEDTQEFSWTPGVGEAGEYPNVHFEVEDDGTPPESDSENITIAVITTGVELINPLTIVQAPDPHIDCNPAPSENLEVLVGIVNTIKPNLFLVTGDLVEWGSQDNHWVEFNRIMDGVDLSIDTDHIIGNHDIRIWPSPFNHSYDNYKYYINSQVDKILIDSYIDDGYILLGLDSNDKGTILNDYSGEIDDSQIDWLSEKLDYHNDARQVVIFMHHPVFGDKDYLEEPPTIDDDKYNRDEFIDLCQVDDSNGNDRVSIVFTGHTHTDGVWEEDGKAGEHYPNTGKELFSGDDGFYNNISDKKTKYIHTRQPWAGYRVIQLFGEEAIYRVYSPSDNNPLPDIENAYNEPTESDSVMVYAKIIAGDPDPGLKEAICYWSTDEAYWHPIGMAHEDGDTYKTTIAIPAQPVGTKIYYRIFAINNHEYVKYDRFNC